MTVKSVVFSLRDLIRISLLFACITAVAYMLTFAKQEDQKLNQFYALMAEIEIVVPSTPPPLTQESVDLAVVLYGIKLPPNTSRPVLDMKLTDRGLTTMGTFASKAEVSVGPAAFTSWGLLGSTLAHEVEVHCNQSFLFITLMDIIGLNGTDEAERQAYNYELSNASRFGLVKIDKRLIADTVSYYYPDKARKGTVRHSMRQWFAKNFLTSE